MAKEKKADSAWDVIQKHMMSGIGYMIPLIMSYTIIKGFIQLAATIAGVNLDAAEALADPNMIVACGAWIIQVAAPACQNLMYPVFAGFLAYSIGSKAALVPGFIGGMFALSGGSGFIGALAIGFASGYFMKWLTKTWQVSRSIRSAMNLTIYPAVGGLFTMVIMYFVINPIGSAITNALVNLVMSTGVLGAIPFAALVGGMMAFDCGGPINKAAFTICVTLLGTGVNMAPLFIGAHVAPLGLGAAYLIDKFIMKGEALPEELQDAGIPALFMGVFSVTEGALPAVLFDPAGMVPINVIGTAIGAVCAELFGVHFEEFLGFGWLCDTPLQYLAAEMIGVLVVAVLTIIRMRSLKKKRASEALQVEAAA